MFTLYASCEEAEAVGFGHLIYLRSFFPGSVGGLSAGAAVTLHGLKIGEVTHVGLQYKAATDEIVAPVEYRIEPGRIADVVSAESQQAAGRGRGSDGQAWPSSDAAGRQSADRHQLIALDFYPKAPAETLTRDGDFLDHADYHGRWFRYDRAICHRSAEQVQCDRLHQDWRQHHRPLGRPERPCDWPAAQAGIDALDGTLLSVQDLTRKLDTGLSPALKGLPDITRQLQDTMTKTNKLLASVDSGYGDNSNSCAISIK